MRRRRRSSVSCAAAIGSASGCCVRRWCAWPRHRERPRDYYEVLGRRPRRRRRRHQEGVPQAGAQAPPRPQRRRRRRRGAVQGGGRSLRGAGRSRQARALRPLRARRGDGRRTGLRSDGVHRVRGHPRRPRRHLRLRRRLRRRPAAQRPAARRRPALRPRDHVRSSRPAASSRRSRSRATRPARTCSGSGAAAGSSPTTCGQCRGTGQLRYQQGFFTMARTCGACRGTGQASITKPCADCRGEGQIEQQRKLTVKIPAGIASGQRLRLQGEGEAGARGGPAGDLYVVIFVQDDERFTRDGNDLHHQADVLFTTLALGGEIVVPGIDGTHTVKVPEGTATGTHLPRARQGHARRVGARQGRPAGDGARHDAAAADPRSAPAARGARRHRCTPSRGRRRRQGAVREGEGHLWMSRGAGPH